MQAGKTVGYGSQNENHDNKVSNKNQDMDQNRHEIIFLSFSTILYFCKFYLRLLLLTMQSKKRAVFFSDFDKGRF